MTTNQQLYSKFHHKLQKISYDIDNFIEKLSNSIEDLDAKPKNYRTQFALGNEYEERCHRNPEKNSSHQKIQQRTKVCKK